MFRPNSGAVRMKYLKRGVSWLSQQYIIDNRVSDWDKINLTPITIIGGVFQW
jgi:hypothetical protein